MDNILLRIFCERIGKKNEYILRFNYNEQLVNRIKELPKETRKWDVLNSVWKVSTHSLFLLMKKYKGSDKIFFDFGNNDSRKIFINNINDINIKNVEKQKKIAELNIKKDDWVKYKLELESTYEKYREITHKYLKDNVTLYPHQIISIMFLNVVRNVLLAMDMGTGKSIISIGYVEMNDFNKVFVITPNSLKYTYYNEIKKFTNSNAFIIGKKNDCLIEDAKYIITNYEYFNSSDFNKTKSKFNKLNINKIDCLIVDECHRIKSSKSNIYKAFVKIFNDKIFNEGKISKVFMSGTPAPSKAMELYNVLHQISPLDFSTKQYFYEYYCGLNYRIDGYGWTVNESQTKYEELFDKISPFTYRKKKSEVLKDLPEKTYQKILIDLSDAEMEIYNDLEKGIANEFINKEIKNPLTIMGKLREYTSHIKIKSIKELINSVLESDEKFVLIDYYKSNLIKLHEIYSEISGLHTGDVSDTDRANIVEDFQNDNGIIKIFLGSEPTSKEGLTLTAASKIGIMTIPWTPGTLDQCTDRCARIGQKNAVNAYIFICRNTIDEYIFELIEKKRAEINQVIDGEKYESNIDQSIIKDLISKIKEKHGK